MISAEEVGCVTHRDRHDMLKQYKFTTAYSNTGYPGVREN